MSQSLPIRAIIGSPNNHKALAKLLTLLERLIQPVDQRDLTEWRQFASIREDLVVVIGASAPKHVILSRVPNPAQQPDVYRNLLNSHQVETYLDVDPPTAGEGFVCAKLSGHVRNAQWPVLGQVLDLPDLEAALRVEPAAAVPSPNVPSENEERPAVLALLRVFTNGIVNERIQQAAQILADDALTANDKLTRIDELVRFPPTASAEQLGAMLGVTKQAVMKTVWWCKNRRGETQEEIDRRFDRHKERRGTPIDRRRVNRKGAFSEDDDDER